MLLRASLRACRRKKVIVPFEVKPLPAAFEERIETPVVVLCCCPDEAFVEELHRLATDGLPIVLKFCQFRKAVETTGSFGTAESAYISTL